MAAEVLGYRDRMLKTAELQPFWKRNPLRESADKLMAFSTELREIAESLPVTAKAEECPPELARRIRHAVREHTILVEELVELADELSEEAEEETPESIH